MCWEAATTAIPKHVSSNADRAKPKQNDMKQIRTILVIIFLIAINGVVSGQPRMQPKKIKAKEDYTHYPTKMTFPVSLFSDYNRESIYSFDKQNRNIGVTYEKNQNGIKTTFSLYLYPADKGFERRLRNEYQNSMQSVVYAMGKGVHATQKVVKHEGEKYDCTGIQAIFLNIDNGLSQLTIFEAGTWFYKIRISTNRQDTTFVEKLNNEIISNFDPALLTELNPLSEEIGVIYNSQTAFRDSILLGSVMGMALRQIEWVTDSVSIRERASGVPDFYLGFHIEGLKAFMEFQHRFDYRKSNFTDKFLRELQMISDANFLNEFVMEEYRYLLFPPKDIPFRIEEYRQWRLENNITINLNEVFTRLTFSVRK
jgi:hypothetical protein